MTDFATLVRRRRWLPAALLVVLVVAAMGIGLGNSFSQDDIPIVVHNPIMADAGLAVFSQPYWPKGYSPDLYRPFATLALSLQWHLGNGAAWPIHGVSILLYALLTLAVWRLARRILTEPAAWIAAALFAVHPVHVEAVAVGVNQSELMVALLAVLIANSYVDGRQAGAFGVRRAVVMVLALVVACFFKESAVVIPGLLVAAELTILRSGARPAEFRILRPLYLACIMVVIGFMALRSAVLGNFAGTFTAEGLRGLDLAGRVTTMLGVVPTWLRLLVWPAHLQADYSPQEIVATVAFGPEQWAGLAILLGTVTLAVLARRRAPAVTFGTLWFALAIFPVSNIAIPTGIVLAERTLLLPSVGFALVIGGLLELALVQAHTVRPLLRPLAAGAMVLLLGLGVVRSAIRTKVWNSNDYLWERTEEDAPLSYRAHHARAQFFFQNGNFTEGEVHAFRAIQLYPAAFQMRAELGDRYRQFGLCHPAVASYRIALRLAPGRSDIRASLIACELWLGQYAQARGQARLGRAWEADADVFAAFLALADSAERANAPPQTVRATLPARFGFGAGVRVGSPPKRSAQR